ncbi:MFS transporter [Geomonas silvestris]|uniref:MFS transporter n=1 Tax=Geomonas silvestris TaxID=2740184 RepID=A0A6V8MLD6_9BACT|nr:MFS transporter [Geomonas silvestris]GFO60840.1 MFS transporter [Geomonas silvestris]
MSTIEQTYDDMVEAPSEQASAWGAVWAMSLCAMVLIASEFLPLSLLTPIASNLNITEGVAGQSISISGVFAVLTSLFLTSMIGQFDRRHVLLFFTFLMVVSGTVVALAPNAMVLMIGRSILGVSVGGFWSMSAAVAMRLVPAQSVPKALAIFNGGNALSTMIAAPLGSFLGGIIGWRGAFFCVVPLVVAAFAWLWLSLPALPVRESSTGTGPMAVLKLLTRLQVTLGMSATMLFFMGQFVLFTYLRPFLEHVTGVTTNQLSLILLGMGVSGLIGTFAIGYALKTRLLLVMGCLSLLLMLVALALVWFGHSLWGAFGLVCLWGLLATSAPVGWWAWVSKTMPDDAEAGGGLMVALVQLAIAAGASVGGYFFDGYGYRSTFLISAILFCGAACIAFITYLHAKTNNEGLKTTQVVR